MLEQGFHSAYLLAINSKEVLLALPGNGSRRVADGDLNALNERFSRR